MRTTLNLSDNLIKEIITVTGINNKTKIIHNALNSYLKEIKRNNIKNLYGKIKIDKSINKLRDLELNE